MNTTIASFCVCRPIAQVSAFRGLIVAAAVWIGALSPGYSQTVYWLSGSAGAVGSKENPSGAIRLIKNDVVILDAGKVSDVVAFTPWNAILPSFTISSLVTNGANSTYLGYKDGDVSLTYALTPFAKLDPAKSWVVPELMPSFFTQGNPVRISAKIQQDNKDTPDWIKAVTSVGMNTWPISLYSSDALDAGGNGIVPRMDMQNAAWAILTPSDTTSRIQLMDYYSDYGPIPAGGTRTVGNYSMITLEHIIFYGGRSQGNGGAIDFRRATDGHSSLASGNRATVQIKGDVAFVGNSAKNLGGAIQGQESLQFDGNAYFVGNIVGADYSQPDGGLLVFNTGGGSSYVGNGGAIRAGSGGDQNLIFNKDAIFVANLAGDMGGSISIHNGTNLRFNGKTVFMGNMSGLYMQQMATRGGGNGGAIVFGDTGNKAYFAGESYFIANAAGGYGGALSGGHSSNVTQNSFFYFTANALFTDNISGYNPTTTTVVSSTSGQAKNGVFTPPANITTGTGITSDGFWYGEAVVNVLSGTNKSGQKDYGSKVRGGGAIMTLGERLLFSEGAEATFRRNSTNGSGGAILTFANQTANNGPTGYLTGIATAFFDNATFTGNVAVINGGAIMAGTYGTARSDIWTFSSTNNSAASVYFGKAGLGSTLTMNGNISYSKPVVFITSTNISASGSVVIATGTSVKTANGTTVDEVPVMGGGAVFANGGLYVESLYSFRNNQTGGSGGALLIGSGTTPQLIAGRQGSPYALILNPLDWKNAGTYSKAGDWALLQNNVAVYNGGAIGSYDGAKLYIGSGAKFLENYAGGQGGAIAMGLTSGAIPGSASIPASSIDAPLLDLRARTGDIIFQGNRAGVAVDTSTVDFGKILDPSISGDGTGTAGYMTVNTTSGRKNDIYVGKGAITGTATIAGTINMDAYKDMKISLNGGIEMDHSGTKNLVVKINTTPYVSTTSIGGTSATTGLLADSGTMPVGLVVFDNAGADIEGVTTIGNGILRIQGTSNNLHWGTGTSTTRAGTKFELQGPASLEANATINANTILIGAGATLRVLGSSVGAGVLSLNAGAGGVTYSGSVNLAGNGRINTGVSGLASVSSVTVGDFGHAAAQTLTIGQNVSVLAGITFANNAKLTVGLFDGGSDLLRADSITLGSSTRISLSSVAQGLSFNLARADSAIAGSTVFALDYKGTDLAAMVVNPRFTANAYISGNDILLDYTTTNKLLAWNAASGVWTSVAANWAGGDTKYVLGDAVVFDAAHSGSVSVNENVAASGMNVTGDYTFGGQYGITTQASAWGGGAAPTQADGRLTMSGTGKMLTLANAQAGQRNEFMSGILITGGTVAAGTEAQLGSALSQIVFSNNTNNGAALLVTNTMILNGASSLQSQRLNVATGNFATIATTASGALYVINNTVVGTGGVINVEAGSRLNLNAQGSMSFLNNTAAQGGALALAASSTASIDVASDKTVMFGLQGDRTLNTSANTSAADSIYGAAGSMIEKKGAGTLSINSNSSGFHGTLNVNEGRVLLGEGSVFGSLTSHINVRNGALLGGGGTIGGNLLVDGGKLSIDGGQAFDRSSWGTAQTLTIVGDFGLNNASLLYNAVVNKSNEYSIDLIQTHGPVSISGSTKFDFNRLSTGLASLIDSGSSAITWAATAGGVTSGSIHLSGTFVTSSGSSYAIMLLNSNTAWNGPTFVTSHTGATSENFITSTNFVISKGGVNLDASRYEIEVGYNLINSLYVVDTSGAITGTVGAVVSQTNFYDASKLVMNTFVNNMKLYWTGESGTLWNTSSNNWYIPKATSDKTFADGDSVVFGATGSNGIAYDNNDAALRSVNVDMLAAYVADLTVTGTGNWTFVGGVIASNAGANNYRDADRNDLSTGQFVLDESFTGTVTLANNGGISFNGAYVTTGSTTKKLNNVEIRNGTLLTSAGRLNENSVLNNSTLIFNQTSNETLKAIVTGTGDIIQTGSSTLTVNEESGVRVKNYRILQDSKLQINTGGMTLTGTLAINSGAQLMISDYVIMDTLLNNGALMKSPVDSDGQKAPDTSLKIRDPGVRDTSIYVMGNYHSDGGTVVLNTYRDAMLVNNVVVTGNSSGTSFVAVRNITSLDSASTNVGFLGTGTFFQPAGYPATVNTMAQSKRDTIIFRTLGGQHDLQLIMDWNNSILPSATVNSIVPFSTLITKTDEVVSTVEKIITITSSGTLETSTTTSGTTSLSSGTNTAHYYNKDGSIAIIGSSGTTVLGSGTVVSSGTTVASGTITVVNRSVVTGTVVVTELQTTYGPSEIDYSESRDNYKLVKGKDGNWYFRNASIALQNTDLPMMGAAPIMADVIGQGSVRAFYKHINARHDDLRKGWSTWANYTHSEDRLRQEYYANTMIKQDIFQVGADYTFGKDGKKFSLVPSINFGGAYAYTSAKATRDESSANLQDLFNQADKSTLSANINTLTGYASARWWRFYLDMLLQYSPDAKYKAEIDSSVPFDLNGSVKGSRLGASAEFGIIITPAGLGQLEIYAQATGQKHDFGSISRISEPVDLTNGEGYNPIYDPNSATGRRYHFTAPTTFQAEGGLRWGSHLKINEAFAVRPWAGLAYGRMISSDYLIYVDDESVRNDMRGNYYTFQGGASALIGRNWQVYLTLGWTNGAPSNNYTLSSGVNYHW